MRERIIQTAQQMFLQYGIKRITIDDIARQLGISKKTFYLFFTSKDDLIASVSEQDVTQVQEALKQIANTHQEPLTHLLALVNFITSQLFRYHPSFITDIYQRYEEDWRKYQNFIHTELYPQLSQVFQKGIKSGIFQNDINASIMARGILELLRIPFNTHVFPPSEYDFGQVNSQLAYTFIAGTLTNHAQQNWQKQESASKSKNR
jgi:TetR/AcrR family transcriptional regulator, cholesterol catabolism regulator